MAIAKLRWRTTLAVMVGLGLLVGGAFGAVAAAGTPDHVDLPEAADHGDADADHGAPSEPQGQSQADHGPPADAGSQSQGDQGKPDDPGSQADADHGPPPAAEGQSDEDHGQSEDDHGRPESPGRSGEAGPAATSSDEDAPGRSGDAPGRQSDDDDDDDDDVNGGTEPTDVEPQGASDKVEICHAPPGNPAKAHTIRVSENAVEAHLAHGDSEDACETDIV